MTVHKPTLGSTLECDGDLVVVIDRRWELDQIADVIEEHADEFDLPDEYHFDVATWFQHTADQFNSEDHIDIEGYWSPAGRGAESIDVAVVTW